MIFPNFSNYQRKFQSTVSVLSVAWTMCVNWTDRWIICVCCDWKMWSPSNKSKTTFNTVVFSAITFFFLILFFSIHAHNGFTAKKSTFKEAYRSEHEKKPQDVDLIQVYYTCISTHTHTHSVFSVKLSQFIYTQKNMHTHAHQTTCTCIQTENNRCKTGHQIHTSHKTIDRNGYNDIYIIITMKIHEFRMAKRKKKKTNTQNRERENLCVYPIKAHRSDWIGLDRLN